MPISLENLLSPVSADNPCGEDVSYDPGFQELDTLILGKPETQFSTGEPPDWKAIRERCVELLGRSKHLRLAVTLAAAQLRLEGIRGFRDGIALIEGLVTKYWEPLYPRLDPEDNDDPTERINIVAALSTPLGVLGDPFKFIDALRTAPLSASAQMGKFSLQDFNASQSGAEVAGKPAIPMTQVDAAFRDTKPEHLTALHTAVTETIALVKSLGTALADAVGEHRMPNFDVLKGSLREIHKILSARLPQDAAAEAAPAGGESADASLGGGAAFVSAPAVARGPGLSGSIESRDEVVRALDLILSYYSRIEPSSPAPLLIERVKRLVQMDFMAIMQDMAPEAVAQINLIAGIK